MYTGKYNAGQKCLDSEQSSVYLLHFQVSYIYINRLCACTQSSMHWIVIICNMYILSTDADQTGGGV